MNNTKSNTRATMDNNQEINPNARLIAAAPEMYETLRLAEKWLSGDISGTSIFELQQHIHKALAKAEGKHA